MSEKMRTFSTGATRTDNTNKPNYIGYLCPLVLKRYGQYMLKHQKQADGSMRPADNWKKGITTQAYLESGFRHLMDLWLHYEGYSELTVENLEDSICAIMFNTMGFLHEHLKEQNAKKKQTKIKSPLC